METGKEIKRKDQNLKMKSCTDLWATCALNFLGCGLHLPSWRCQLLRPSNSLRDFFLKSLVNRFLLKRVLFPPKL